MNETDVSIKIKDGLTYRTIQPNEIIYIRVFDYICEFLLCDDAKYYSTYPLSMYMNQQFENIVKVHRNCAVNIQKVVAVNKDSKTILLCNGISVQCSYRMFPGICKLISNRLLY